MTDLVTIAPYEPTRLNAVWQLRLRALKDHPESFGEPWESAIKTTLEEVANLAATFWTGGDNQLFIASNLEGEPIGMLGIIREQRPRERHRMKIWGVYVTPEYRGQGVSTSLARAANDHARSFEDVLQIQITVWSGNLPAITSYTRLGFQRWGTMSRADIIDGEAIDYDHMVVMLDQ